MPRREGQPEQPEERKPGKPEKIPEEELDAERAGPLPDREALSVIGADVAIPLDPSIAADVLSGEPEPPGEEIGSEEKAGADQQDEDDG